jgi:hypothetical protein
MVHVEIFLGGETGEETIGARYQRGTIQIFPSYLFESKLWKLKQLHFCSIETWLDGQCRSVCPEHQWLDSSTALLASAGSRSIFYDSEDDISAGEPYESIYGAEDEEGGGGGDGEESDEGKGAREGEGVGRGTSSKLSRDDKKAQSKSTTHGGAIRFFKPHVIFLPLSFFN